MWCAAQVEVGALTSASDDGRTIELRDRLNDGVIVITARDDEVD